MGIDELLAAVRRGWWVLALCGLLTGVLAYTTASDRAAVYQSTARFVLAPAALPETRDLVDTSAALKDRSIITTFAEIMTGTTISDDAARDPLLAEVRLEEYTRHTAALPAANVVELTVKGPHPGRARVVATTVARLSIEYFQSLYPIYRVDILDTPSLATAPVEPKPARDTALAAFGGLMVGVAIVIVASGRRDRHDADPFPDIVRLDDTVRDADGGPRTRRARVAAGATEHQG